MATFVIVHGAFAGGWYMRPLALRLRAAGHEVFTPTLTGFGERVHLAHPAIDLDTHIQDVVHVLYYEDLWEVILVGKSYGGMVITGVAERIPERLGQLVYVEGAVPEDGQSLMDLLPPALKAEWEQAAKVHGEGWRIPIDPTIHPRITAAPLKPMQQPLAVNNAVAAALPRTYIYTTDKQAGGGFFEACARRAQAYGWDYYELPTGHEPEQTMPQELAELLITATR
jgi:pimeloyl-ACP methyl ester carboxylesterase